MNTNTLVLLVLTGIFGFITVGSMIGYAIAKDPDRAKELGYVGGSMLFFVIVGCVLTTCST